MIIEICSKNKAEDIAAAAWTDITAAVWTDIAIISITSLEEPDVVFAPNRSSGSVLHLKFNDLKEEYDEEGIPYGRPLPKQSDFTGLKEFVSNLSCERLVVHCWEGTSRSAAVAAAVYEFRGRSDILITHQRFAPNPLVYAMACRELGIRQGSLRYESDLGDDCQTLKIQNV